MHINVHCAVAICLSMIFLEFLNVFQIILIISASILIDFDFLFSKYAKDHNHRRLPTHSFIPYLILIPFGLLMIEFLWIGIAGIFHVLIDVIDWGIYPLTPRINDKVLGGVCGGLAVYFSLDPVLLRLLFVLGLFISLGTMIIVYCILWLIIPQRPSNERYR